MSTLINPTEKLIVLDFDHTCYDTDAFVWFELRQTMINRFHIPVGVWEEAYKKAAENGYTLGQHYRELMEIMKSMSFDLKDFEGLLDNIHFQDYLYSDVLPLLKEAKEKDYQVMILSFGAPTWQEIKINKVGLDKVVDLVEYVTTDEAKMKMQVIEKYARDAKVIFVDNKGSNLDEVHNNLPKVETYLITRIPDDTRYVGNDHEMHKKYLESRRGIEAQALPVHKRCNSFKEIIL